MKLKDALAAGLEPAVVDNGDGTFSLVVEGSDEGGGGGVGAVSGLILTPLTPRPATSQDFLDSIAHIHPDSNSLTGAFTMIGADFYEGTLTMPGLRTAYCAGGGYVVLTIGSSFGGPAGFIAENLVDIGALTSGSPFYISSNMSTFRIGMLVKCHDDAGVSLDMDFSVIASPGLPVADVDRMLDSCANMDGTGGKPVWNGTLNLTGGNPPPSNIGPGSSYAKLILQGATVLINVI